MDEKLNADAMGMRMSAIAGRGDATTQFAANGLSLRAHFPDWEHRFDTLIWFYGLGWLHGLGLFDFFDNGFILATVRQHLAGLEHLTEPAGDFLDDLRQPLDG